MLISFFPVLQVVCLQLERVLNSSLCCGARNKDGALLRDPVMFHTDKYLANALRNTQKETIMLPYGPSTPCHTICSEGSVHAVAVPQPGKGRSQQVGGEDPAAGALRGQGQVLGAGPPPGTSEPAGAASPRPGAFTCQDHPVAPALPTCCRADDTRTDAGKRHAVCELTLLAVSAGQEEIKDALLCAIPSSLLIPPGFPLGKEPRCMQVGL